MNEFDPYKDAPEDDPRNAGRCEDCGHFEDDCRCIVTEVIPDEIRYPQHNWLPKWFRWLLFICYVRDNV